MTDAGDFDAFVQRLREVFFALRGISEVLLADLHCTPAERGVLQDIETNGPLTVPAMAQARAVSRQAMQKTIDQLVDRRLLKFEANPRHLRSSLVAVTPAGSRLFVEIRQREARVLSGWELPVSPAELRRTTQALQQLGSFLSSHEWRTPRQASKGGR